MNHVFKPERIIFYTLKDDGCRNIPVLKKIILYALLVSYGIRVDTRLFIADTANDKTYIFDGFHQRYLYAQDKSLTRYLEKIFCERIEYPGVSILEGKNTVLEEQLYSVDYIILVAPRRPLYIHADTSTIVDARRILVTNTYMPKLVNDRRITYFTSKTFIESIPQIHYILDRHFGAWIRRRGRIKYFEAARC